MNGNINIIFLLISYMARLPPEFSDHLSRPKNHHRPLLDTFFAVDDANRPVADKNIRTGSVLTTDKGGSWLLLI